MDVSRLCATADIPFAGVTDPVPLMAKPFGNMVESPDLLFNLGHILSGLQIGRTMRVVDFGSGTCWLSRCLNQLGCSTVSVDVSQAALNIGRKLFKEYPPVGGCIQEPVFLLFDGHKINLPDESVDRVICFDSFHHVPNQAEVIAEFSRILKPGGIAGFSEPGRYHSRSEQSQHEMRTFGVLENDMILEDIRKMAINVGFTEMVLKLALNPHISYPFQRYMMTASGNPLLKFLYYVRNVISTLALYRKLLRGVLDRSIFMLHKGPFLPDSRLSHVAKGGGPGAQAARDLQYAMTADLPALPDGGPEKGSRQTLKVKAGEQAVVNLKIANTGSVAWLHNNVVDYAVVKIGGHLCDSGGAPINYDFLRGIFDADVQPGQEVGHALSFRIDKPGRYRLVLDLVSERIVWFEASGSKPVCLDIEVA